MSFGMIILNQNIGTIQTMPHGYRILNIVNFVSHREY